MTLPLTDSALIGSCLAAAALGLVVMTSSGGNGDAATSPAPVAQTAPAPAAPEPTAVIAEATVVEGDFGAQVRAYLLENPEVIFEAVAVFEQRNAMAQAEMGRAVIEANAEALFNDGHSWVGGNPEGDITLVEFVDYRCGFCKRALDEVLTVLDADPGIRLVMKEFPILGPESELASRFAISVLRLGGNEAYETAHYSLLRHDGALTPEFLDDLASELGLDFAAIAAEMESPEVTQVIAENRALAQRLQISGTPTFVMEDELIRGYVEAEDLLALAESLRE
jgi:protein-disulfide isomerase